MIDPKESVRVRAAILDGPHPFITLKVWDTCRDHVTDDSGRVELSRAEIAEQARVSPSVVSRAITRLVGYGAMRRRRQWHAVSYWIDSRIGWADDEEAPGADTKNLIA